MTKQADELGGSPNRGSPRERGWSASGPRGGAVAGRPRRGSGGWEGGGKSAALPLAAWLAAGAGGEGSGGSVRPGDSHSPVPPPPHAAGPWTPGGGARAAMAHVTQTPGPRDRDPGAREAGWGPSAADPRSERCQEPVGMGARRVACVPGGASGTSPGGGCGTVALGSGKRGAGGAARGLSCPRAGGNRGDLCGWAGGAAPGKGGGSAWPASDPPREREREREALCPSRWTAAEGAGTPLGTSLVQSPPEGRGAEEPQP